MVGKGGLSPKRKGDAFEAKVATEQRRIGRWCERIRQGQGELVDLVALESCSDARCSLHGRVNHVYFIQCRLLGNLSAVETEQLQEEARTYNAIPLLAWKQDGQIQYKRL
mgnify:FL=1